MLFARSPSECQFYMDLHPCGCSRVDFEWSHHYIRQQVGRMVSVYQGVCDGCGDHRMFEFEVSGVVVAPPAFGGAQPSLIIDPAEFLTLSRRAAAAAPADPRQLSGDAAADALDSIEMAVAALEEVLKFIPADAPAVPADAFRSDAGRAMYAHEPQQFERVWLERLLGTYRAVHSIYARLPESP
jgi:hypothetical protein